MGKIEHYLAFVKEQVGVQQSLAKKYEDSPFHIQSFRVRMAICFTSQMMPRIE